VKADPGVPEDPFNLFFGFEPEIPQELPIDKVKHFNKNDLANLKLALSPMVDEAQDR